jgi:predicted aconitase
MSKVTEILVGAREILSDPNRWTREFQARDIEGRCIAWNEPEAVCFCLMGAINRASRDIDPDDITPAYDAMNVLDSVIDAAIPTFNDRPTTTHEDVLKALDAAIKMRQT